MRYFITFLVLFLLFGCEEKQIPEDSGENNNAYAAGSGWAVDTNEMTGTSIRNSFPVVTNPSYKKVDQISIPDKERVIVVRIDAGIFVYPLRFMGIEVLNDVYAGEYFVVTHCPLTQSNLAWNRIVGNDTLTFSASGVLYKENLVPYDLETESMWSQMLFKGIHGQYIYVTPQLYSIVETNWGIVKKYLPNSHIYEGYNNNSKFQKNEIYTDTNSTNGKNEGLYQKGEMVYGFFLNTNIFSSQLVFTKSHEDLNNEITIEELNGIVVVSSEKYEFIVSFYSEGKEFIPVKGEFPVILEDENGIKYDIFGYPESNQNLTEKLRSPISYSALWWAWTDFYDSFEKI